MVHTEAGAVSGMVFGPYLLLPLKVSATEPFQQMLS